MQNLPFATGDADMAALMVLVTVQSAQKVHLSLFVNAYLIDTGYALSGAFEDGRLPMFDV